MFRRSERGTGERETVSGECCDFIITREDFTREHFTCHVSAIKYEDRYE
jgi:hypothetical protein